MLLGDLNKYNKIQKTCCHCYIIEYKTRYHFLLVEHDDTHKKRWVDIDKKCLTFIIMKTSDLCPTFFKNSVSAIRNFFIHNYIENVSILAKLNYPNPVELY